MGEEGISVYTRCSYRLGIGVMEAKVVVVFSLGKFPSGFNQSLLFAYVCCKHEQKQEVIRY